MGSGLPKKENFAYYRNVPLVDRWYVYIARCSDGSLYTGIAKDVAARLAAHDAGKGARYTRGRGPLTLHAKKRCDSKGEALRLELAVKALNPKEKSELSDSESFRSFARRVRIV